MLNFHQVNQFFNDPGQFFFTGLHFLHVPEIHHLPVFMISFGKIRSYFYNGRAVKNKVNMMICLYVDGSQLICIKKRAG